jgi:5-methyltetrahydrofolate--homocysteine methyltransferase
MNTIWFDTDPIVKEWENPPAIRFDEQSEMWQNIVAEQKIYAADPDVHFSITDIGGIMDVVAALRGTENLLYDLYDYPDEVKEFTQRVKEEWFKLYDRQLEIVSAASQPYNNWMNIPSSKPWYPLQCDFCYMISPKQFSEFVLDDLIDQVNYMPRSIYHLDGVGELPHIDMLLDIEGLTGIQWTSGAGNAELWDEKWFDLYRKIQDKKKNIVLLSGISERDEKGAERLIKSLDPTGVYISFGCSSEDKAKDMLEKISRWSE